MVNRSSHIKVSRQSLQEIKILNIIDLNEKSTIDYKAYFKKCKYNTLKQYYLVHYCYFVKYCY